MSATEAFVLGYLLNSAWQAPLLFAAGWVGSRLLRRVGTQGEHWMWVGTLAAATVVPACNLHGLRSVGAAWRRWGGGGQVAPGGATSRFTLGPADVAGALRIDPALGHAAVVVYLLVLLYSCGRLLWGVGRGHALCRDAVPLRLLADAERSWERCCQRFGVADAELASSDEIQGPVTLGIWRRLLLAPTGFVEAAEPGDLEAALAHEFAHMRRRDYGKNLLYEVLSLPVKFHPFTLLIKSQVAQSRELLCDEMAAGAMGRNREYAKSLLRLAAMISRGSPARNVHAIGIFDANILERRVMNLTVKRVEVKAMARLAAGAACVVLGVAACGTAMALRMEVKAAAATAKHSDEAKEHTAVTPPTILSRKSPVYPAQARADKNTVNGTVMVKVMVGEDGKADAIQIVKSLRPDYDRSALDAVKDWTFTPAMRDGKPIAVEMNISINYELFP